MADSPQNSLDNALNRVLTVVTTVLVLAGLFYLGSFFYNIVVLIGVSLVVTYVLLGPVGLLESALVRLGRLLGGVRFFSEPGTLTRALSVTVVYLGFFAVLTVASVNLLPILGRQVQDFVGAIPRYIGQAESVLIDWTHQALGPDALKTIFQEDIQEAEKEARNEGVAPVSQQPGTEITEAQKRIIKKSVLKRAVRQASAITETAITTAWANLANLVVGTVRGFIFTLAGVLLVFYFLMDGKRLRKRFEGSLGGELKETAAKFMNGFHQVMFAFIKGQLMLGILTGGYMFIIYTLFDVNYAFFLGSFFAVSELLPVVGTWIGITPGIVVMLFSDDPMVTLWVWLCSYAFQTVKDNVLAPKIVGDVMGLHPVVVIFALIICAKAAGLVGILLALPLASLLNIVLAHFFRRDDDTPLEASA